MGITTAILEALIGRLKEAHQQEITIEYLPGTLDNYRLVNTAGIVFVGYSRSQFSRHESLDVAWMSRELTIPLTLVCTQLPGGDGVIHWLDKLRLTLTGWTPPHCHAPLTPSKEEFIAHYADQWQYTLEFTTQTNQLQD